MKQTFLFSILFLLSYMIFLIFDPMKPDLHGLEQKANEVRHGVKNMNNGGCGWFALYASDYLDKEKVMYQIVYIFASDNKGSVPNHVMIKLNDDCYFDDDGVHHKIYYKFYGDSETVHSKDELRKLLNGPGWNSKFDVSDTVIINHLIWK